LKRVIVTDENRDELRYRCLVDLYFLAKYILGYDKLIDRVHLPMAKFFVQKKPKLPIEEQDTLKKRMLIYPRFTYKSTLDISDIIQWLACFPEVIIFPITAGGNLGNAFVDEVQQHLTQAPEGKPKSLLEQIFPDLCVPQKDFLVGKYWHPARVKIRKEPSLLALSPGMNISGFHAHIMKEDDCVNNVNSRTMNGIVSTRRDLAVTRDMLDPDGYNDRVGTPYNPLDSNMQDLRTMLPGEMKLMRDPCWKVKESAKWKLKDWPLNHPLPEEDYELLFPEKLSYRFLCSKMAENFPNFCAQYLLDPQGASGVIFTEEMLQQSTVPAKSIKPYGDIKVVWVLRGDAVAGMVALYEHNRMCIVDQIEGRFLPSQLVNRILKTSKKWGQHEVKMLKTAEAAAIEDEIRGAGYRAGWELRVSWIDEDAEAAVQSSIKGLEAHMASRRLIFSDDLPALGMLYDHFQQFTILEHKEIAEAIAILARWIPRAQASPEITSATLREQRAEVLRKMQEKDRHQQAFGLGRYATPEPVEPKKEFKEERHGLEDDLGGLTG
jgi:hypothetical protein